jgi:hypothetical protein
VSDPELLIHSSLASLARRGSRAGAARPTGVCEWAPCRCSLAPRAERNASAGAGDEHVQRRAGPAHVHGSLAGAADAGPRAWCRLRVRFTREISETAASPPTMAAAPGASPRLRDAFSAPRAFWPGLHGMWRPSSQTCRQPRTRAYYTRMAAVARDHSTSPLASSQRWLQYFLSCATVHLQAGCAHFFCSRSAMVIPSYRCSGWAYFLPPGGK